MGIKKDTEETGEVDDAAIEAERQRQRKIYSQLDQQYSVARSITHTARGQGLGFH